MYKRIIPCLDIKDDKVAKGVKFKNLKLIGDPIELARKYSEEGADELVLLEVSNSPTRKSFLKLVKEILQSTKTPLIIGGRIDDIFSLKKLVRTGRVRVCLYTSFVKSPEFLLRLLNQTEEHLVKKIIIGIDVKKKGGNWIVLGNKFQETDLDVVGWASRLEKKGVAEIIITSMNRDGTGNGYDIKLSKKIKENINLPVIIAGGAGRKEDFLMAFTEGGADAALAAGIFHFGKVSIPELKRYLKENKVNVHLSK